MQSSDLKSPCKGQCELDPCEVCLGCGRRLDEITNWIWKTDQEKQQISLAAMKRLISIHKVSERKAMSHRSILNPQQ